MKPKITLFTLACGIILTSCDGEQTTQAPVVTAPESAQDSAPKMIVDTFKVETGASEVKWSGSKAIGKGHSGFIRLKEGWVGFSEGKLVSGDFTIDMTSIVNLDLKDEKDKTKLVDHLKSKDFFNVDSFPTAHFVITAATDSTVTGNLTLKTATLPLTFSYKIPVMEKSFLVIQSKKFSIDRTKWGIVYNTATIVNIAKDHIIADLMELEVSVNAEK